MARFTEEPARAAREGAVVIVPESRGATGRRLLPKLDPSAPFLLFWNPRRWAPAPDGVVEPELLLMQIEVGVNGTTSQRDERGQAAIDYDDAVRSYGKRGWMLIPPATGPDGSYVRAEVVENGVAHIPFYAQAVPGSSGIVRDNARFRAWIDDLRRGGVIGDPDRVTLQSQEDRMHREYLALAERGRTSPSAQTEAAALLVQLNGVRKFLELPELADANAAPAPAPQAAVATLIPDARAEADARIAAAMAAKMEAEAETARAEAAKAKAEAAKAEAEAAKAEAEAEAAKAKASKAKSEAAKAEAAKAKAEADKPTDDQAGTT